MKLLLQLSASDIADTLDAASTQEEEEEEEEARLPKPITCSAAHLALNGRHSDDSSSEAASSCS
jgi:hypothetical protein